MERRRGREEREGRRERGGKIKKGVDFHNISLQFRKEKGREGGMEGRREAGRKERREKKGKEMLASHRPGDKIKIMPEKEQIIYYDSYLF